MSIRRTFIGTIQLAAVLALGLLISPALASHSPDLTNDSRVDQTDLGVLITQWSLIGSADLNHDAAVNARDAGILFSSWGVVPPPPPPPPPPTTPPPPPPPPTSDCTRTLSGNITIARLDVAANEVVCFDSNVSTTVLSTGNVVVRGTLRMRPGNSSVVHTLRFINVNEGAFIGGDTLVPLDTDVGLWIMDEGIWDAQGSTKTAWLRTAGGLLKGTTIVALESAPSNWQVGDELIITPTVPPSVANHWEAYDYPKISAMVGTTVTLNAPVQFDHPAVTVAPGKIMTTEVLNVTRNVRVEGQPGKRAHIMFNRGSEPQTLKYLDLRYLGTRTVLGRYPLHFHKNLDGSRGSLVEGVVIRDSGNSAFVPHMAHGVTFRDTIGHDVLAELWGIYGWDEAQDSDDIVLERCVASRARTDPATIPPGFDNTRLTAFPTSAGVRDKAVDCVGVGTAAPSKTNSVILWPEGGGGEWDYIRFVGHNAQHNLFFTWSNTNSPNHNIIGSILYHAGRIGLEQGAYANAFLYQDTISYGNKGGTPDGTSALVIHATSKLVDPPLRFVGGRFDGNGAKYAAEFVTGHVIPDAPVQIKDITFTNYTRAAAAFTGVAEFGTKKNPYAVDFIDNTFSGSGVAFWLADTIQPESVIRVRDAVNGSLILRHKDDPRGIFLPEWNAKVEVVNW